MGDGARTHDHWNHNPGLYQLSYAHQKNRILTPRKKTGDVYFNIFRNPLSPHHADHLARGRHLHEQMKGHPNKEI